jgi:hypothetical protein
LDLLAALRVSVVDYAGNGQADPKIEKSLLNKIDVIQKSLEKEMDGKGTGNKDYNEIIGKLNAFINEVQAQRGKKISTNAADDLVNQVNTIIDLLASSDSLTPTITFTPVITQTGTSIPTLTQTPASPTDIVTPTPTPSPTGAESPATPTALPTQSE